MSEVEFASSSFRSNTAFSSDQQPGSDKWEEFSLSALRRNHTRVRDEYDSRNSMRTDLEAPNDNAIGSYLDFMRLLLQYDTSRRIEHSSRDS